MKMSPIIRELLVKEFLAIASHSPSDIRFIIEEYSFTKDELCFFGFEFHGYPYSLPASKNVLVNKLISDILSNSV